MKTYMAGVKVPESEAFAYVTGHDGHYLLKRNRLFEASVRVACVPGHPEQREFFRLKVARIPMSLVRQVLSFMKGVYEAHHSEALALLTFEGGEWGVHVPSQEVSEATVKYENSERRRIVGSIHSHPGFSSEPSGTDEHDEMNFDGIHIVTAGFIPIPAAMTAFAAVNGRRFRVPIEEVVEGMDSVETSFPEEWLAKVRRRSASEPADWAADPEEERELAELSKERSLFPRGWEREDCFPY
ncbi:MAG: Mov34/MPN/PAD-1 family protein [Planctomycetes bacterium]|nr:Mov34/MPN/PAD-1 family protein [Planctomycetota bacterium]